MATRKKTAAKKTATKKKAQARKPAAPVKKVAKKKKKATAAAAAPSARAAARTTTTTKPKKKAAAAPAAKPAKKSAGAKVAPSSKKAPLLWRFNTDNCAWGIWVDEDLAWMGDEDGLVFALDHKLAVQKSFKLPSGVKSLIADERWRYVGCDDGNVYDLTGRAPRVVYAINDTSRKKKQTHKVLWIDIVRGNLCVADNGGGLTVFDAEDNLKWQHRDAKDGDQWMVRGDGTGVFVGGARYVEKYDWDGKQVWQTKMPGDGVLFGVQSNEYVYAATKASRVLKIAKDSGDVVTEYKVNDGDSTWVLACCVAPDGRVFCNDDNNLWCFADDGTPMWCLKTGCGDPQSMQFHDEYLYLVTNGDDLACFDVRAAAIAQALKGKVPKPKVINAPKIEKETSREVEQTKDAGKGVVVECFKDGSQVRVRVVSPGYKKDWFCQFPRDIREVGAKFVVDQVVEASQGGFYRVLGDIKRLS